MEGKEGKKYLEIIGESMCELICSCKIFKIDVNIKRIALVCLFYCGAPRRISTNEYSRMCVLNSITLTPFIICAYSLP